MSNLEEGLKSTIDSIVNFDREVITNTAEALANDDDLFAVVSHILASTETLEKVSHRSSEHKLIMAAALLLNYFEYKEK